MRQGNRDGLFLTSLQFDTCKAYQLAIYLTGMGDGSVGEADIELHNLGTLARACILDGGLNGNCLSLIEGSR